MNDTWTRRGSPLDGIIADTSPDYHLLLSYNYHNNCYYHYYFYYIYGNKSNRKINQYKYNNMIESK